jgi:hypothetical protein
VGDFNGDGKLDLATANENAKTASILLGEQIAGYSESGIVVYGTGTHYVLASYAGDTSRFPSQSPTVPLIATAFLPQTISFTPIASPVTIGVPPISLSATGGGTLNPVTFSVLSGPGYVSGNWLYVTGVGTIVVAADQAGNSPYSAAPEVTQSVVVNKITPTFSVSCSPNPVVYGANTTCTAVVSGGATGTVAFYDNGVLWATVSVSGNSASATGFAGQGSGTYSVTTSYSGDANNNSASAGTTVTVTQAPQSITFTPPATPVTFGVAPIALSARFGLRNHPDDHRRRHGCRGCESAGQHRLLSGPAGNAGCCCQQGHTNAHMVNPGCHRLRDAPQRNPAQCNVWRHRR